MNKYLNKIIQGDALEELKKFPDESINCVMTSPPYFNLRDYGVEGQIGLEKTYQEYIKKLIDVFDEVKRVLKKDGTCFVNLGDSYFKDKKWGKHDSNRGRFRIQRGTYPEKCLMMIPERFAIAMIDKGWILRNKLVWVKRNAMPESVKDRWKKAHEYIFFFTKSKNYYFNLDKIRTPYKLISVKRAEYEQGRNALGKNPSSMGEKYGRDKKNRTELDKYMSMPARSVKLNPKGAVPPDFLDIYTKCAEFSKSHFATYPIKLIAPLFRAGCPRGGVVLDPFAGVATTGLVAKRLGCNYICIELNPDYVKEGEKRLAQQQLL